MPLTQILFGLGALPTCIILLYSRPKWPCPKNYQIQGLMQSHHSHNWALPHPENTQTFSAPRNMCRYNLYMCMYMNLALFSLSLSHNKISSYISRFLDLIIGMKSLEMRGHEQGKQAVIVWCIHAQTKSPNMDGQIGYVLPFVPAQDLCCTSL